MLKPTVIMIKIFFVTSTAVFIRYLQYRSVPFRRYYRCPKWFSRTCFSFVTFCCLHVYLYIHSYLKPDEIGFLPWTDLNWFCLFFVFCFCFVLFWFFFFFFFCLLYFFYFFFLPFYFNKWHSCLLYTECSNEPLHHVHIKIYSLLIHPHIMENSKVSRFSFMVALLSS